MTTYRVEFWCDGCGAHLRGLPFINPAWMPVYELKLAARAQKAKWVIDGDQHFCPACQIDDSAPPETVSSELAGR